METVIAPNMNIVFGYPETYYNKSKQAFSFFKFSMFAILILFLFVAYFILLPLLNKGSDIIYPLVVIIGMTILIPGIWNAINAKQIFINEKTIQVKYKFLQKKNFELFWDNCIGYFPSKYLTSGGGSGLFEIELYFPSQRLIVKTANFKQGIELDLLLDLVRGKGIKNLNQNDHSKNGKFMDLEYKPPKINKLEVLPSNH